MKALIVRYLNEVVGLTVMALMVVPKPGQSSMGNSISNLARLLVIGGSRTKPRTLRRLKRAGLSTNSRID